MRRAARHVAGAGVRQFLDVGTGLPSANNTHEVAQAVAPESRIVYVDNDPIVLAHARALLTSDPRGATGFLDADARDTQKILSEAGKLLDFSQPVALMLVAVLHMIPEADDPYRLVADLVAAGGRRGSIRALGDARRSRPQAVARTGCGSSRGSAGTLGVMRLHVGCAMWTYAPWQGRYLPPSLPQRERLRAYATWCNAVEGNTTFYATPTTGTVRSWAGQTSPDFRFVLKLPKAVTHESRLDADGPLRAFLTAIEPLGPRAHTLWIQLPPSFSPIGLDTLDGFLRGLPRGYRYCVEVRHRAFFTDPRAERQLETVLGRVGAEWVPFDTTVLFEGPPASDAEREAQAKKPRVPRRSRALTACPVVRYIGRDDAVRTVAGWRPWLETVAGWLREGRSPTVFLHTPDNVGALELARRFHEQVRARVPEVEPLPEPVPAGPPTLF